MDEKIVQEMLHELISSLEALETQNTAVLKFLKDKGIARDEELAPYLEQAGNASGVRWLGVRVRMDHLLSSAMKTAETEAKKPSPKATNDSQETAGETQKTEKEKTEKTEKKESGDSADVQQSNASKSEPADTGAQAGERRNQGSDEDTAAQENRDETAA
jgi:hypothetical protein